VKGLLPFVSFLSVSEVQPLGPGEAEDFKEYIYLEMRWIVNLLLT
jgi:hypothetical protein